MNSPIAASLVEPTSENKTLSDITLSKTNSSPQTKNNTPTTLIAPLDVDGTIALETIIEQSSTPNSNPSYTEKDFERALTYGKQEPPKAEQLNVQYGREKSPEEQPNLYKKQTEEDEKSTASETMTTQEANSKLQDIQYAQVTGNIQALDLQERRRFATWAQYNPEFLSLFHRIHAVTGDVNYSRTF